MTELNKISIIYEQLIRENTEDDNYIQAVQNKDLELAQKIVNNKAKRSNFNIIAYHGTAISKNTFRRSGGGAGVGAYFSNSVETAREYAEMDVVDDDDNEIVMKVYLSINHPKIFKNGESHSVSEGQRDVLEKEGYDSVIGEYSDNDIEYLVFDPSNIKSAEIVTYDDNGDIIPISQRFNKQSTDIRY